MNIPKVMDTTFLYVLTDPVTGSVRYLGKSDNPFKRLKGHLRDSTPSHKKNWIDSLKSVGLTPYMDLLDEVPVSQWEFWEREYIRVLRAIGIPLTNQREGGDGGATPGGKQLPETCAKISASLTWALHPMFGKKQSPETCVKRSNSMMGVLNPRFGKPQCPEQSAKQSKRMSGISNPNFGTTSKRLPLFSDGGGI